MESMIVGEDVTSVVSSPKRTNLGLEDMFEHQFLFSQENSDALSTLSHDNLSSSFSCNNTTIFYLLWAHS